MTTDSLSDAKAIAGKYDTILWKTNAYTRGDPTRPARFKKGDNAGVLAPYYSFKTGRDGDNQTSEQTNPARASAICEGGA
jgi:hypothetical protein